MAAKVSEFTKRKIRHLYEAGEPYSYIWQRIGVTPATIRRYAKQEDWLRPEVRANQYNPLVIDSLRVQYEYGKLPSHIIRDTGISTATFYRWRKQWGTDSVIAHCRSVADKLETEYRRKRHERRRFEQTARI